MEKSFVPKIFTVFREGYSSKQFSKDLFAGIIVGIVAIPLAISFAIASGVSPEKGLYTAIIAGFIISAFGGSRVQIGGPTGAFIVIVYGIVQQYGVSGLTIATFMAGVIIFLIGISKLGTVLKYIPYPLIVGFTSGIALVIFTSQIRDFLGLRTPPLPGDFIGKWDIFIRFITTINWYALALGSATILITLAAGKIFRKIPGTLLALLLTTLVAWYFQFPVETISSRFGEIPAGLPKPEVPTLNFEIIKNLIQPAFAIALLGTIESLLSAIVSDGMIGGNHRSNVELMAQGAANVFSSVFGGIPATGAIARTATNIKNGGRTPVAGIIHALTLLLVMLFFG